MIMVA